MGGSNDYRRVVGDCIYDYSKSDYPILRESVHTEENMDTDLGGEHALLSSYYWYFGENPKKLPEDLFGISHPSPGHKSKSNTPYVERFIAWIESLDEGPGIRGQPQLKKEMIEDIDCQKTCSMRDTEEARKDLAC